MNFFLHSFMYSFLVIALSLSGSPAWAQGKAPTQQPAQPTKQATPPAAQPAGQPAPNTVPPPTNIPDVEPPNTPAAKVLGEVNALISPADKVRRIDHFLFSYFEGNQKNFGKENVLTLIKIRHKECSSSVESCQNITDLVQAMCSKTNIEEGEKFFWKSYFAPDSIKTRAHYAKQLNHFGDLCGKVTEQDRIKLLLAIFATDLKGKNQNLQDELVIQISKYKIKDFQNLDAVAPDFFSVRDQLQSISPINMRVNVGLAEAYLNWLDAPLKVKNEEQAQLLGAWVIFIADSLGTAGRSDKFARALDSHPEILNQMRPVDIATIIQTYCKYWTSNGGAAKCDTAHAQVLKRAASLPTVINKLKYHDAWRMRAAGNMQKTLEATKEIFATARKTNDTDFVPWVLFLDALVKVETGRPASQEIQSMHSSWNEGSRHWSTYQLEGLEMLVHLKKGNYKEANEIAVSTLKKIEAKVIGETGLSALIKFRQLVALIGLGQSEQAQILHQQLVQKLASMPDYTHLKHFSNAVMNRKNKGVMESSLAESAKVLGKNHPDQLAMIEFISALNKKFP